MILNKFNRRNTMEDVASRLKRLRIRHGLSQRKLAVRSGVSNATISLIEHGRTDPSLGLPKTVLDARGVWFAECVSEGRAGEKFFYSSDVLRDVGSGRISYRRVRCDLLDCQLQSVHERDRPGADTGQSPLSDDAEEGGIGLEG